MRFGWTQQQIEEMDYGFLLEVQYELGWLKRKMTPDEAMAAATTAHMRKLKKK